VEAEQRTDRNKAAPPGHYRTTAARPNTHNYNNPASHGQRARARCAAIATAPAAAAAAAAATDTAYFRLPAPPSIPPAPRASPYISTVSESEGTGGCSSLTWKSANKFVTSSGFSCITWCPASRTSSSATYLQQERVTSAPLQRSFRGRSAFLALLCSALFAAGAPVTFGALLAVAGLLQGCFAAPVGVSPENLLHVLCILGRRDLVALAHHQHHRARDFVYLRLVDPLPHGSRFRVSGP